MYLEISPRHSGKTTRLVEAVLSCAGPITIVSNMREQSRAIENVVNSRTRTTGVGAPNIVYVSASNLCVINFKSKMFVDEFDYFNEKIWQRFNPASIEAGYFVTTARQLRSLKDIGNSKKDMLCRLLQLNKFQYNTYPTLMSSSQQEAVTKQFSAVGFELEIRGRFIAEQIAEQSLFQNEKRKLERRIAELEEQLRIAERSW